jgi:hypothetical protein
MLQLRAFNIGQVAYTKVRSPVNQPSQFLVLPSLKGWAGPHRVSIFLIHQAILITFSRHCLAPLDRGLSTPWLPLVEHPDGKHSTTSEDFHYSCEQSQYIWSS